MSNTTADKAWVIFRENLTPTILEYASLEMEQFWIVSVIEVKVSKDYSYADFFMSAQKNVELLPKYLAEFAPVLRKKIWKELWARKSPNIRFRVAKNWDPAKDVLSIINEISNQYGLN